MSEFRFALCQTGEGAMSQTAGPFANLDESALRALARHLIRMLIGKVRSLTQKVLDLALKDVYGRFAKFIDESAVEQKGMRVVAERLTQHDIAARIGGSREMVNRIVKDLTAGGYISGGAQQNYGSKKTPSPL